jgi:hypothetical protein
MTREIRMKFREFDSASIEATRKTWREDGLKEGVFLPDIEQQLDWAFNHTTLTDNAMAYGVFKDGGNVASAICELVITKPSARAKWIKFLSLRLRPSIDAQIYNNDPAGIHSAIDAYIACVTGVFKVKNEQKANTIKVYGRTQQQMSFLAALATNLSKTNGVSFKTSIEGRWLVLHWKSS